MKTVKKIQVKNVKELSKKEMHSIFGGAYMKVIINGKEVWLYIK